jgi:hypothetical protein
MRIGGIRHMFVWMALVALLLVCIGGAGASAASRKSRVEAEAILSVQLVSDRIGVRPAEGPGGTEIRVNGYVHGGICRFRGVSFDFVDANGTRTSLGSVSVGGRIRFVANAPTTAVPGAGTIRAIISVPYGYRQCRGIVVAETTFSVTLGAGIFGFTPRGGQAGTSVVITGIRFKQATVVRFGHTAAEFTIDSGTQITATVPVGATTAPIRIITRKGTAVSGPSFKVLSSHMRPA